MVGIARNGSSLGGHGGNGPNWAGICTILSKDLRAKHRSLSGVMAKLQAWNIQSRHEAGEKERAKLIAANEQIQAQWASLKAECASNGYEIYDLEGSDPPIPTAGGETYDSASGETFGPGLWDQLKQTAEESIASTLQELHDVMHLPSAETAGQGSNANADPPSPVKDGVMQDVATVFDVKAVTNSELEQGPLSGSGGNLASQEEADAAKDVSPEWKSRFTQKDILKDIVEETGTVATGERNLEDAGMIAKRMRKAEDDHHMMVQELRAWFESKGINIDDYKMKLTTDEHGWIHNEHDFNQLWKDFKSSNEGASRQEIIAHMKELQRQVGLEGIPIGRVPKKK